MTISEPHNQYSSQASVVSAMRQNEILMTKTVSSEVQVEVEASQEEMLFLEHELTMQKLREKQEEQALNDS